jgi:NAD(P)-dependent dehydrogenase (short-subunit alcohol dehydrogenase family)
MIRIIARREPELLGRTLVVIGGSSGIGWETARRARSEGAEVILVGRTRGPLEQAARRLDAIGTAAFDATDPPSLAAFFGSLAAPDDHVMVTAGDPPDVARATIGNVTGSLIFMSIAGDRRSRPRVANLALEFAPVRVNLIAAGFVDMHPSASNDELDARRAQLVSILPIGRLVAPSDVAELAVHLMIDTAITGATYDIDGGQQLVE